MVLSLASCTNLHIPNYLLIKCVLWYKFYEQKRNDVYNARIRNCVPETDYKFTSTNPFLKKNKTKKPYNLLHFETDTLVVQGHAKFSSYRL